MTSIVLLNKFQSFINKSSGREKVINESVFAQKSGLMAKLFGCRHENIGRPFNYGNTAYRSCLNCGARRQFNPETLETYGSFYFPPVIKTEQN